MQPDKAPAEEVAAMIRSCPSDALGFRYNDGAAEAPPKLNRIAILKNGPLAVSGDLDIEGDETTRATLCRCGLSKTNPIATTAMSIRVLPPQVSQNRRNPPLSKRPAATLPPPVSQTAR